MAVTLNANESNTSANTSADDTSTMSNLGTSPASPKLSSLQRILQTTRAMDSIRGDGRKYIEDLTEEIARTATDEVKTIARKEVGLPGMVAFTYNNLATLVVMEGSVDVNPIAPTAAAIPEGINRLRGAGLTVINSVVICKADYALFPILAKNIINEFRCYNNPDFSFDMAAMSVENYDIVTDIGRVRAHIANSCPHAVQSRVDIGLTLLVRTAEDKSAANYYSGGYNNYNGQNMSPSTEFISVGGYVQFLELNRQQAMGGYNANFGMTGTQDKIYQPTVMITEITGSVRSPDTIIPALAAIAEVLLRGQGWKHQFQQFSANVPNIGNLIMVTDDKNNEKPYHVGDMKALEDFIQLYCTQPMVAFRITEGRSRIPGITKFLSTDVTAIADLNSKLSKFFNVPDFNLRAPATKHLATEFTGTVQVALGKVDSRYIDYLFLAANGLLNSETDFRNLKFLDDTPLRRADLINRIVHGSFERSYIDHIALFDWKLLADITNCAAGKLKFAGNYNQGNGQVSYDPVIMALLDQRNFTLNSIQAMNPVGNVGYSSNITNMYG